MIAVFLLFLLLLAKPLPLQNPTAHPRGVIFFANLRARKFAVDPGDGGHISYKINHSVQHANLRVVAERAESGDDIVVFRAARVRFSCAVSAPLLPFLHAFPVCVYVLPAPLTISPLLYRTLQLASSCCTTMEIGARTPWLCFRGL